MSRPEFARSFSETEQILAREQLHVEGQLSGASNATLLCSVDGSALAETFRCVYKPQRGERPLWDFPSGTLGRREVGAYLLSELTGWSVIPPTVWRDEGPFGPGMCQAWVDDDVHSPAVTVVSPDEVPVNWRVVLEARTYDGSDVVLVHEDSPKLKRMAILDIITNNADRKGSHVLRDSSGGIWGIDHGLTFHVDDKLRTVLWGWAGESLDPEIAADLESLAAKLMGDSSNTHALRSHLTVREFDRLVHRVEVTRALMCYPEPSTHQPALPWPPM